MNLKAASFRTLQSMDQEGADSINYRILGKPGVRRQTEALRSIVDCVHRIEAKGP